MFTSIGTIRYSIEPKVGHKVVLTVDQGIVDYYRSLIPKARYVRKQRFPAHISVVRKQVPPNLDDWGKHEGKQTEFVYSNVIHNCEVYYWLNAYCVLAEQIREELGLPLYTPAKLVGEFRQTFHITLGSIKQ